MARIDTGDALTSPIQQPGAKLSNDGYGLLTATVVYKGNTNDNLALGVRGSTCPINANLAAHKYSVSYDNLGTVTLTVDYIGIDPDVNGGDYTNPQVSTSNGLTSEPITTNPNFRTSGGDGYGGLIAGSTYTESSLGPVVSYMDPDTDKKQSRKSFIGLHGACFETPNGGRFIGFVNPAYSYFYGKTNYLAPQSSFSGHFYTTDAATIKTALEYLGTTSYDNDWGSTLPKLVPDYAGTTWHAALSGYDQLLLAQVNISDFGSLYKVMYEVRYSVQGWPNEVYRMSSTA